MENFQKILTNCALPGIGKATAGDLLAFAWNMPAIVVETNVRSVFIHFFFKDKDTVKDIEILPLIERALDKANPREWYYALFDYGSYLKKTTNPSRRSAHHVKQSAFSGSYRQKRAEVLRTVLKKPQTKKEILKTLQYELALLTMILLELEKEEFIKKTSDGLYKIA